MDPQLEKFLCEQALRNLRLRLVFSYVTRQRHKSYDTFVIRNATAIFVRLSEALLLEGVSLPTEFEARIPILEREFKIEAAVLRELLALKSARRRSTEAEMTELHGKLFALIDDVVRWMEERWPG